MKHILSLFVIVSEVFGHGKMTYFLTEICMTHQQTNRQRFLIFHGSLLVVGDGHVFYSRGQSTETKTDRIIYLENKRKGPIF